MAAAVLTAKTSNASASAQLRNPQHCVNTHSQHGCFDNSCCHSATKTMQRHKPTKSDVSRPPVCTCRQRSRRVLLDTTVQATLGWPRHKRTACVKHTPTGHTQHVACALKDIQVCGAVKANTRCQAWDSRPLQAPSCSRQHLPAAYIPPTPTPSGQIKPGTPLGSLLLPTNAVDFSLCSHSSHLVTPHLVLLWWPLSEAISLLPLSLSCPCSRQHRAATKAAQGVCWCVHVRYLHSPTTLLLNRPGQKK
jgi:hypothetical protein